MAISVLKYMPEHSSREILTVCGSLTTCDPFDINFTIKSLRDHRIRVSIIGLAAEVRIMRILCKNSGGLYLNKRKYTLILFNTAFLRKICCDARCTSS